MHAEKWCWWGTLVIDYYQADQLENKIYVKEKKVLLSSFPPQNKTNQQGLFDYENLFYLTVNRSAYNWKEADKLLDWDKLLQLSRTPNPIPYVTSV